jgi:hypothetical protein
MPGPPSELYPGVLNCTAAEVARRSKGSRERSTAGTASRSANPMPFPRIPQGRYHSVVPTL